MISALPAHTFTYAGCTHNVYHCTVGEGLPRHEHTFQHATVCHSGKIIIRKENFEMFADKSTTPIVLKENAWHEIEAVEDGTVFENIFVAQPY
jgi:quercetin dioxygenase-like cupin family protein